MNRIMKRNWMRTAVLALSILLVCMVVLNIARSEELSAAETRISAVYEKAFYETCELTESISSNYRKLLVAGDMSQMQTLLGEISRQTQGAASNLALLPLGEETISATIKFINQAEDFAESLSQRIAAGGEVTDADYETMEQLSESAARFSVGLLRLLERFESGEAVFNAGDFTETGDETLYPLSSEAAEYPVLLYDGPFSDGSQAGTYELLSTLQNVSRDEAEARLRAFIPVDELDFTGESRPEVDCYEFHVRSGNYWISAGVTKQGGEILYLLPETDESQVNYTETELCDIAQAFLVSRGYGTMEMSFYSRYSGILTINFAAVQDGVVLYPDLVKLQISMRDGRVIGIDAENYLKNHVPRTLTVPAVTEEQAMQRVSARLTPLAARLCVIPVGTAEYLCYEVSAGEGESEFLVYVDAQTGVERELMQLISRNNGTLVM